ncbi:FG-GAP repeat domain-containing protein [Luteitalea pratensis]|uniref:FG-GAP repeat domain-containing protein n=1 Tax=Luteitalea pratensis TaxID=1855912 RepID=UPI0012FF848D|nr:VCBS repeat-containing protein [Luteitalea pratensis]
MASSRQRGITALLGTLVTAGAWLAAQAPPAPRVPTFRKVILDGAFRAEGIALADVNRDGRVDVMAGNAWYGAPLPEAATTAGAWARHEIAPLEPFDAPTGFSNAFHTFALDVNGDGWPDQVVLGYPGEPASWRANPGPRGGVWRTHPVSSSTGNESPAFARLVRGRGPVLVMGVDEQLGWLAPAASPFVPFTFHPISEPKHPTAQRYAHGLGVGDINGDGRADVVSTKGYWVAPETPGDMPWPFTAADLGPDAAHMAIYDVNVDGLADIVASAAHQVGVWWFEQKQASGTRTFVSHEIDASFSQSHALDVGDIDNDGIADVVTGKRRWAHGPTGDPQPNAPGVLYWYQPRRSGTTVSWTKHLIDDTSGVGNQVVLGDVDGDGRLDVASANKHGVFVFLQR